MLYVGLPGRSQRQPGLLRRACRLPFEANPLPEGKPGRLHHLSLKDNSVIDKLDRMQAVGVASAKIEGRLRTPEYVAAAVSACLAGREGRAYDRDLLKMRSAAPASPPAIWMERSTAPCSVCAAKPMRS